MVRSAPQAQAARRSLRVLGLATSMLGAAGGALAGAPLTAPALSAMARNAWSPGRGAARLTLGGNQAPNTSATISNFSTLPTAPSVVSGLAAFISTPNGLNIVQSTNKAIINWSTFSIGQGASVTINNGSGATLNRVLTSSPSIINGLLSSTGSVYVINPNGVIIGKTGVVNTAGTFVASSLDVDNNSFLTGANLRFQGASNATVLNQGSITSSSGDIALIGAQVENQGQLQAPNGVVSMGAGSTIVLADNNDANNGDLTVEVGGTGANVTNSGLINAASAELRTQGGNIYALAGNSSGIIRATGVDSSGGRIWLVSDEGATSVAGTIEASGAGGQPGQIETSGETLSISAAKVDAHGGSWLLDPTDLTIDSAAASTIDTALNAGTNVTEKTTTPVGQYGLTSAGNGDIFITAPMTWFGAGVLTLDAYHSIYVQSSIQVIGAGGVIINYNDGGSGGDLRFASGSSLQYGIAVGTQSLSINGHAYTIEYSLSQLATDINAAPSGSYALGRTLLLSGPAYTAPPITSLQGTLEGLGNSISNLTINDPSGSFVGLIGDVYGTARDLILASGSVSGSSQVGGLTGHNTGLITNIVSNLSVTGGSFVGGIVGYNDAPTVGAPATVSQSLSTGSVTSSGSFVGGLAGLNQGIIADSQSSGGVTDTSAGQLAGGIVGRNDHILTDVLATGSVAGVQYVGGIVGSNTSGGTITNALSTGAVTGSSNVGGLAGANFASASSISHAYWDTQASGQSTSAAGTGETTTQLKTGGVGGFTGGFSGGTGGSSYPYLTALATVSAVPPLTQLPTITPINWSVANASSTYGTLATLGAATLSGVAPSDASNVSAIVSLTTLGGASVTLSNKLGAGSYLESVTALAGSAASSYSLSPTGDTVGTLTVARLALTGVLSAGSSIYGAALSPGALTFTNLVAGDTVTAGPVVVNTTGLLSSSGNLIVGSHPGIESVGSTLSGSAAANYTFAGATAGYSVTAAPLSASLTGTATKVYDGTTTATLSAGNYGLSGVVSGDAVTLNDPTSGLYATKDAGSGKTVTVSGLGLAGADAANYTVALTVSGAIGQITPKSLSAALTGTVSKVYDGTTTATLSAANYALSGVVLGDSVSLNNPASGAYDTANAGTGKTVTVTGLALSGASLSDYSLISTTVSGAIGIINPAPVGVSSLTWSVANASSTYGTLAVLGAATLSGVMSSDQGQVSGTVGAFTQANASITLSAKTAAGSYLEEVTGLSGSAAANYVLSATGNTNGMLIINPKALTASLTGTVEKTYDGTTTATLAANNYSLSGVLLGDSVSLNSPASGAYDTANAGTGKTVTATGLALSGASASNYTLSSTTTSAAVGTIDPKALTASLTGTVEKTYDGTTTATLAANNYSLSGVVNGDAVTLNDPTSGLYATAAVGSGKTVTVSGLGLVGTGAANYIVASTVYGAIGQILPLAFQSSSAVATSSANPFNQPASTSGSGATGSALISTAPGLEPISSVALLTAPSQDAPTQTTQVAATPSAAPAAQTQTAAPPLASAAPGVSRPPPSPPAIGGSGRMAAAGLQSGSPAAGLGARQGRKTGQYGAPAVRASAPMVAARAKPSNSDSNTLQAAAQAMRAAKRGNEAAPGDVLAESFNQDVWLDNSSIENTGASRSSLELNREQSLSNLISTYIFFFFP